MQKTEKKHYGSCQYFQFFIFILRKHLFFCFKTALRVNKSHKIPRPNDWDWSQFPQTSQMNFQSDVLQKLEFLVRCPPKIFFEDNPDFWRTFKLRAEKMKSKNEEQNGVKRSPWNILQKLNQLIQIKYQEAFKFA